MTFMHTRAKEERAALQAARTRSQRPASAGLIYAHACKIYKMQQGCRICGSPVLKGGNVNLVKH